MLLRDAIAIPTEVRQGDLVFRLTDATEHTTETLEQYVVTPQLRGAFLDAVRLVRAAIREHSSKAAFLSGSFGAGKSNFMGVLQLLLDRHPSALAQPDLAEVVAELAEGRDDQRFLTVPFHLIGASSLESAIFGRYVEFVRARHPEAPMPDVFASEPILRNAEGLREQFGDEHFFAVLNGGGDDGWGDLGGWNADRYAAACAEPADGTERRLLVQALLETLLSAFADGARTNREGYVDIDTGLAALSRHAHDLGYDGLILFLDELILWLMSRMADAAFVTAEAAKISKLVEASDRARPAPIISIIARQRDLRDLIGTDVPGAERLSFIDQLNFQAGRFSDIRLDDTNLPLVANRRLLQPIDEQGARALADAFRSLALTDDQRDALRGATGTDADFALTYPFSPAFLTVVVDVAGALQRTRTGLRVLLDLLVRNRDTLEVGQLVPVGDLFDVLVASDEPLSDAMRQPFDAAKRIYRTRLRPMLLAEHGLPADTTDDAVNPAFVTDDRLVKTLLLAALVPNSEPFRDLTARKLLALNHGLIASPVPGLEAGIVVTKLGNWAAKAGEIQVGSDPHNPTVTLMLSEVDTRKILNAANAADNPGNRRKLVRDLLAEELGVATDELMQTTKLVWRGVARPIDLVFGNIRNADELVDRAFASNGANWKVVIDFPFDDDGHTPVEDLARIERLREQGHDWRTVCWVPAFFTSEIRSLLGDLVRLNHLVPVPGQVSDRLREAVEHLNLEARESVRPQLEAQQRAARDRLRQALKIAYGLSAPDPAVVDTSHALADHFASLIGGFRVQPPVAATLREAFDQVIAQALEHTYPGAPAIEAEVRTAELRTVYDVCLRALEQPDRRIPQVPPAERRTMQRIANPLRIGVQAEQAFVLDVTQHWDPHLGRKLAARRDAGGAGQPTVGEVRTWLDDPRPMGLSRELQNLVIAVWAVATDRMFTDHGGPARVGIDNLADHYEVVSQELPDAATWDEARHRAEHVLGIANLPVGPSAVGLTRLSNALAEAVAEFGSAADELVVELGSLAALIADPPPNRAGTAANATALLRAVGVADGDKARIDAFVAADMAPSAPALGASIKAAAGIVGTIREVDREIIGAALTRDNGGEIEAGVRAMLEADELATPMAPGLRALYARARDLVVVAPPVPPVPPPVPPQPPVEPPVPPSGGRVVRVAEQGLSLAAGLEKLDALRSDLARDGRRDALIDIEITATFRDADE